MIGRLAGKVALVTGGASGIGAETSRVFAREGAKVAVVDANDNLGHGVAQEIGEAALYAHLDTRDEAEWQAVVQQVVDTYGRLDILVNAAGVSGRRHVRAQHRRARPRRLEPGDGRQLNGNLSRYENRDSGDA